MRSSYTQTPFSSTLIVSQTNELQLSGFMLEPIFKIRLVKYGNFQYYGMSWEIEISLLLCHLASECYQLGHLVCVH